MPHHTDQPGPTTWRAAFAPLRVGRLRLALVEHATSATPGPRPPPSGADTIELVLEPGDTFGAGTHPSTRLALALIDRHLPPGATMLDVGSGSGVLGIGALLLGATAVCAVDHDLHAVTITSANADRNGVGALLDARHGSIDAAPPGPFDLVAANLLLPAHATVAHGIAARAHPDSLLIVAGILDSQVDQVVETHHTWDLADRLDESGWTSLAFVRQ